MRLLSETLPLGLPGGPVFAKAYPEIEPDALSNVERFMQGQPFDVYARLRSRSAGGVAARGQQRARASGR